MTRSRLSYPEAVRLLLGGDDPVTLLGRAAGGAMLVAAPFAEGVLSWFDYKGEANNILRELLGRAPARIRAVRGRRHFELLEAAHTVLVLAAFFESLTEHVGDRFAELELTDGDRGRIGAVDAGIAMPDAITGFTENLPAVERAFRAMHATFCDFADGLAAAQDMTMPEAGGVVTVASRIYRDNYVRLSVDIPEFGVWAQLDEFAATRAEVRRHTETLTGVADRLARLVDAPAPAAVAGLARHYARVLERPLWRSDAPAPDGLVFPPVADGFVSPRFRLAVCANDSALGDESWWRDREIREDLDGFLSGYLTAVGSTQRPMIVLGHPGAGKSLLTEVLAARIPATAYTTIRVPLRRVDPDMPVHDQIVTAVEMITRERLSWGELCRGADTTKVVLLDGFDELVQATGVTQSHYVEQVAAFQRDEWDQDRPVIVLITSRTLVMDRTVVRDGTLVLKLEPFDEPRVVRWARAWNTANRSRPGFRPLTGPELWRHTELAGQPLLLLMLAVYASENGHGGLDTDDLSSDQLYRRLLDTFIRRQIREKSGADLGDTRFARLEAAARRDLAAVAFAMFTRRRQWVGEEDLSRDLEALHPEDDPGEPGVGEPVSRARRTVAAFFFVHVAKTDDEVRVPGRRSYEFLHATFGEYLVAEHTVDLLSELAGDWARARSRAYQPRLDDRVLRALSSHQPFSNGERILPFLIDMISLRPDRDDLRELVLELFRTARQRVSDDSYRPTPFDVVTRAAAYTANLALLAVVCGPGQRLPAADLTGFESTVRLWRSGLDPEVQQSLFVTLRRSGGLLTLDSTGEHVSLAVHEADLVGDVFTGAALRAGRATLLTAETGRRPDGDPDLQRSFHARVVRLLVLCWPAAGLARLNPYDEEQYAGLAAWLDDNEFRDPLMSSLYVLGQCLLRDGMDLADDTLDRLLRHFGDRWRHCPDYGEIPVALLALNRPALMDRHPWLRDLVLGTGLSAYLHEVARVHRDRDPGRLDPVVAELRRSLAAADIGVVVPSMVTGLRSDPRLIQQLMIGLSGFEDLVWSQIAPSDLSLALGPAYGWDERTALIVADYVAARREEAFDGPDAEAFRSLWAGTTTLPGRFSVGGVPVTPATGTRQG